MARVRFENEGDLKKWLRGQPRGVAAAIAARAAMRALPALETWLARDEEKAISSVLPTFRAISASRFATVDAKREAGVRKATRTAARAAAFATTTTVTRAAAFAAYAADAAAARAARAAPRAAAYAAASATTVWKAVEDDAHILERQGKQGIGEVMHRPLWPGGMPEDLQRLWTSMKRRLLAREGEHWEVWTTWYDARIDPSRKIPCYNPPDENLERARILLPEEVWEVGPATANAEIRRLLEESRCAGRDEENYLRLVPVQEAATIEVEWRDDRLVLKERPLSSEEDASLLATLRALGQQLRELVERLRGDAAANAIDPRVVEELEKVVRLVPQELPLDESQAIQLAMQVDELRAYFTGMSEDERAGWPEVLRRKLETQLNVLHGFLEQFRTWEKVHAADVDQLSDEEVQAAPDMAEEVARGLKELGEERVDPDIIQLLRQLKARLLDISEAGLRLGRVAKERAADLWESINNIAKALGEKIVGWLGRKAKVFGKALDKNIDDQLEKLAEQLARWGRRLVFPGAPIGAGSWLAQKFGWLSGFLEWLQTHLPKLF